MVCACGLIDTKHDCFSPLRDRPASFQNVGTVGNIVSPRHPEAAAIAAMTYRGYLDYGWLREYED